MRLSFVIAPAFFAIWIPVLPLGCIDISVEVHPCAGEGDSSLVGGSSFAVSGGESAKLL